LNIVSAIDKLRVMIVDDHAFFAKCLRAFIDNEPDLTVCDIVADPLRACERISRLKPDLLVIDVCLGTESGLNLGRQLRALGIITPILFASMTDGPGLQELVGILPAAFMAKNEDPAGFSAALRQLAAPAQVNSTPSALTENEAEGNHSEGDAAIDPRSAPDRP
jgi:DNA-binding NarL/FixJ family response regulator